MENDFVQAAAPIIMLLGLCKQERVTCDLISTTGKEGQFMALAFPNRHKPEKVAVCCPGCHGWPEQIEVIELKTGKKSGFLECEEALERIKK